MDESRELNAVIDVIMLAGTILLKSGSEIHRVEDTMIHVPIRRNNGLQCSCHARCYFLFYRKHQYFSDETGNLILL